MLLISLWIGLASPGDPFLVTCRPSVMIDGNPSVQAWTLKKVTIATPIVRLMTCEAKPQAEASTISNDEHLLLNKCCSKNLIFQACYPPHKGCMITKEHGHLAIVTILTLRGRTAKVATSRTYSRLRANIAHLMNNRVRGLIRVAAENCIYSYCVGSLKIMLE